MSTMGDVMKMPVNFAEREKLKMNMSMNQYGMPEPMEIVY